MWSDLGAVTGKLATDSGNIVGLIQESYNVSTDKDFLNLIINLFENQTVLPVSEGVTSNKRFGYLTFWSLLGELEKVYLQGK